MDTDSNNLFDQLLIRHENHAKKMANTDDTPEGLHIKLRAVLVALLGFSISACAFASQPVELEIDDEEVAQRLSNVNFVRRITKPTIRLAMGYGKLSACMTALTSLLLLVAIMSKQSWWHRGAKWLAVPALLVAALEATSDAADAVLASILRGSAEMPSVIMHVATATALITIEMLVWYFIAKFFEYKPNAATQAIAEPFIFFQAQQTGEHLD